MNNLNIQNLTQVRVCPHGRHWGRFGVLERLGNWGRGQSALDC